MLRGVIALAFAAFAFSAPATTVNAFVYIVGAYFIISGIAALVARISFTGVANWWSLILMGLVEAALGFVMLSEPGAGPLAFAYLFAIWMISSGVLEISSAMALRNYVSTEFWWILLGIITLAFGFYIALRRDIGVLALVYTVAAYAVLAGCALIAFAFRIKNIGSTFEKKSVAA